jgi:hypothetical protein
MILVRTLRYAKANKISTNMFYSCLSPLKYISVHASFVHDTCSGLSNKIGTSICVGEISLA